MYKRQGYHCYWNYADKKGYSGTAIFTKYKPLSASYGLGDILPDSEGRIITLEYDTFYIVTVYTPNSKDELARLPYRMTWEDAFRAYLLRLNEKKPVIFCGDLNVAHKEIDLKNPKTNRRNAGFTDEERSKFSELLDCGFIDTFRYFYPTQEQIYSCLLYTSIALRIYAVDQELGLRMIAFLRHEETIPEIEEKRLLLDPLSKARYIPLSYFKGATDSNGYTPSEPYTITVKDNGLKSKNKNEKTVFIGCGGSGTYRPVTLFKVKFRKLKNKRFEDDAWFVKDYSSLMLQINTPQQKELKETPQEMP